MPYGTINADVIGNSNGMTGNAIGPGFKNRIINGAMVIDQRNAGASVTITTDPQYTLDRWKFGVSQASKASTQRSTVAPAGFTNSILVTSLSAWSIGASDYAGVQQDIEGFNAADLGWGAAGAKSVTISFWVRSSVTGTFAGSLRNSGQNRSYIFTYSISAANTWEYKTVTVAGDTAGTWLTDNSVGIRLNFNLGTGATFAGSAGSWAGSNLITTTGSVNLLATNGATFYITGVQLEVGETATSFDYRPYGTELALCLRYYEILNVVVSAGAVANLLNNYSWAVKKRAAPTLSLTGSSGAVFTALDVSTVYQSTNASANGSQFLAGSIEL